MKNNCYRNTLFSWLVSVIFLLSACTGTNPNSAEATTSATAEKAPQATSIPQSAPQIEGPCPNADERANINGTEVTCKLNSAGQLAWVPENTSSQQQSGQQVEGPCPNADERANINGTEVTCKLNSAGQLAWVPENTSSGQNSQSSGSEAGMARLTMQCNSQGTFGFGDNGLLICDGGKWRYALPEDAKPNTDGSRPDWYPTLDAQFMQKSNCNPAEITLTHTILPLDQLAPSIPYGAMINDHVTPIDHAYIGIKSLSKPEATRTDADWLPVTAPADGTIIEASSLGSPWTNRVVISHGCGVYTVYMVLNRLSGVLADVAEKVQQNGYVSLNLPIHAGEEFGQQRDNPLDFNIFSADTWLTGFTNPLSYVYGEAWKPYVADPNRFFTPELAARYSEVMQKTSEPRWGKIDHDIPGTAAGNWFLEGTIGYSGHLITEYASATSMIPGGPMQGKNSYAYGHLSISPHEADTNQWVFSTGWWQDPNGDPKQIFIHFDEGQKHPDELTSADGMVIYGLSDGTPMLPSGQPFIATGFEPRPVGYTMSIGEPAHSVAMQVNPDGTLSLELFINQPPHNITSFGPGKRTYHR